MARRDYGFVRDYASLGSDLDDIQNFIAAGYRGALFNYADPGLDKAIRDAQAAGIPFGIWGDPNVFGDNNAAYVARMRQLHQQYNPELIALDLENSYKGDPGSANWNKMGELAAMWQAAMPNVRTAITPLGSPHSMHNWNVKAWGPNTEWMPQAYGANSHQDVFGAAQIVQNMIAAGVDPSMVSPILADGHYNTGMGGYGGSAMWTIDDFIGKPVPKASGPVAPRTDTGGLPVPTTSTTRSTASRYTGPDAVTYLKPGQRVSGLSQSTSEVKEHGLRWGGQMFSNKQDFNKYLQQRGSTYAKWAAQHKPAAQGLTGRKK